MCGVATVTCLGRYPIQAASISIVYRPQSLQANRKDGGALSTVATRIRTSRVDHDAKGRVAAGCRESSRCGKVETIEIG